MEEYIKRNPSVGGAVVVIAPFVIIIASINLFLLIYFSKVLTRYEHLGPDP